MSITVRDVMQLPVMGGARLMGGEKGLKNEVLRVSVMEVPDFHTYNFEPGLFLLSTFSCFQNDHGRMIESFTGLAEKKLAGILLKLNRFIADVPVELMEIADRKGVPLLVTEENIKFRDVIFYTISSICSDQMTSAMLYELIYTSQGDEAYVRERLRMLGFEAEDGYAVLSIQPDGDGDIRPMRTPLRSAMADTLPGSMLHPIGDGFIALVPLRRGGVSRSLPGLRRSAEQLMAGLPGGARLRAGCARERKALAELGQAYAEARRSVRYGRLVEAGAFVHLYDDFLEFEMVAHIRGTEEHGRIRDRVLSVVSDYDARYHSELWSSLSACFARRTLKDAAEALCVHISTLRYRLGKIHELTGLDYFRESDRYILRTAYILSLIEDAELGP